MATALQELQGHLRLGDLAAARGVSIPQDDRDVAAVYLMVAEGRLREAVTQAKICVSRGRVDHVLVATIVAYADADDGMKEIAVGALPIVRATKGLAADPCDATAWVELIAILAEQGRVGEAWLGLRTAGVEHVLDESIWEFLIATAVRTGDSVLSLSITRDACKRWPDRASFSSMRAILAVCVGAIDEAVEAIAHAHFSDPRHALVSIARARLAAAIGDELAAAEAMRAAIALGAPREAVEYLCHAGQLLHHLGR
jgi:hypothetical protein